MSIIARYAPLREEADRGRGSAYLQRAYAFSECYDGLKVAREALSTISLMSRSDQRYTKQEMAQIMVIAKRALREIDNAPSS